MHILLYIYLIVVRQAVELVGLEVEEDLVALAHTVRVRVSVIASTLKKIIFSALKKRIERNQSQLLERFFLDGV